MAERKGAGCYLPIMADRPPGACMQVGTSQEAGSDTPPEAREAARSEARGAYNAIMRAAGLDTLPTAGAPAPVTCVEEGRLDAGGLPADVLRMVLASFSPVELCNVRAVCRAFYSYAACDSLWRELYAQRFGTPPPVRLAMPFSAFHHFRRRVRLEANYLSGRCHRQPQKQPRSGRPRRLRCAALSDDLLVGASGASLLLWRMRPGVVATLCSAPDGLLRLEGGDVSTALALSTRGDGSSETLVAGTVCGALHWTGTWRRACEGHEATWGRIPAVAPGSGSLSGVRQVISPLPRTTRLGCDVKSLLPCVLPQSLPTSHPARAQLAASDTRVACAFGGVGDATVWDLSRGECVSRFAATEPASLDDLATVDLHGPLLWTGSENGVLRLWDLRSGACEGLVRHAEGCSRLQAKGHNLISAAATLSPSRACIAARQWELRRLAAGGGQCIRLYCASGYGTPSALQFDTEKLVIGSADSVHVPITAPTEPKLRLACRRPGLLAPPQSEPSSPAHSICIFMMRDAAPVLRPVASLGEPGGTQFAHYNSRGLMVVGAAHELWDFSPV